MNVQAHSPVHKPKGDLYLLIKKQHLTKLRQMNSLYKPNKSPNIKNSQSRQSPIKPISQIHLSTQLLQPVNHKIPQAKINRKDSQVSIVEDFIVTSIHDNKKSAPYNQNSYVINVSTCPQQDSKNVQEPLKESEDSPLIQAGNFIGLSPQILEKNINFKAFFQYILDFKLMRKDSYNPRKNDDLMEKTQESHKFTSRKLPNSLAVKFPEKQAEKYMLRPHQINAQIQENKQIRNRQLQNSQISIIDVRISSASIDDFAPMLKNQHKRLAWSPSSQMKKSKKVYFDFQNPRYMEPDHIEESNPIIHSENNVTIINRTQSRIVSLEQLKKRLQNTDQENTLTTHHGYFCDQCKADPIVGKRYRCIECDQYDLCEKCYQKECNKYGKILKNSQKHQNLHKNKQGPSVNTNYLFQVKPIFKKQMSDILEEQNLSQDPSSQTNLQVSSENDFTKIEKQHVHLMQEVHKPKPMHQINFDKILRETNRCSMRSINEKNNRKQVQNFIRNKPLFHTNSYRQKIMSLFKLNKSRLAFSQKSIPFRSTQINHRKWLDSKRKQIQNVRKSSQSISNVFK